jgi:hypothetical protein
MRQISRRPLAAFALNEGPPIAVAVLIVNSLRELGSFAVEFALFLPIWFAVGWAYDSLRAVLSRRRRPEEV